MHPSAKRKFGRVDLDVTAFAFGTAPIGNIFREIDEATSDAMFQHAWDAGVRYFDTAPMYGHGLSELRTGQSLRWKRRDDFVLSSKVGRLLKPAQRSSIDFAPWANAAPFTMEFDYSYDGTMRSVEDSLQRLALERIDILFIHDIDVFTRGKDQPEVFKQAMDGCYKALEKLRSDKVVKAIGVGVNEWEVCHEALQAARLRLLPARRSLHPAGAGRAQRFPAALREARRGGGRRRRLQLRHPRRPAPSPARNTTTPPPRRISSTRSPGSRPSARAHDVPLPAAALQFVVAHPAIPSFIAGTRTVEQLDAEPRLVQPSDPARLLVRPQGQGLLARRRAYALMVLASPSSSPSLGLTAPSPGTAMTRPPATGSRPAP